MEKNWKLVGLCITLGLISIAAGQFSQLSYSDIDIHGIQPNPYENKVPSTTTTTMETPTTKKKGGFFSGLTNIFKSKKTDEEVTTATPTTTTVRATRPTTTTVRPTAAVQPIVPTIKPNSPPAVQPTSAASVSPTPSSSSSTRLPQPTPEAFPALPTRSTPAPSPITPKKEDFPALPTARPASIGSNTPTTTTRRDDFPPLPGQGGPQQTVTTPRSMANPWTRTPPTGTPTNVRPGVNFVPRSTPATGGGVVQSTTERPKQSNELATDQELKDLSEILFNKDVNNQNKFVTANFQGRTYSSGNTDEAPNSLLVVDETKTFAVPTIEKMRLLFNNYELDSFVNEFVTPNEKKEENEFLDEVMKTTVMRQAMLFLQEKGRVTADPKTHRDLVKTIWFNLYSRGQGKIGSSGFEHVFLTEMKNGTLIGMHNWLYFYEEEKAGKADYKGYSKKLDLGNKGSIAKIRFNLNDVSKPTNSLFIGTSPELELALYTVCFEVRPDKDCPLGYNGKTFNLKTFTYRYRGKTLIGSAYPEI